MFVAVLFLVVLFLLFGLTLYDTDAGFTHGPIHIAFAILITFNLIIKQIAIEGLKTRLAFHRLLAKDSQTNSDINNTATNINAK